MNHSDTSLSTSTDPEVARAVDVAQRARRVVIFSGAGMSKDSGLDTFRDAQTGLWEKVNPMDMASVSAWQNDRDPIWAWYLWRLTVCRQSHPHPGHDAVARWNMRPETTVTVVTQNVDDLHERAGSTTVHHLHGSLFAFRCDTCGTAFDSEIEPLDEQVARLAPPHCPQSGCPGYIRPGVVWFGEALPTIQWQRSEQALREADLVVIVGTSGVVYPAASLPLIAHDQNTPIIEISPQPTELSDLATTSLRTTAAEGLPAFINAIDGVPQQLKTD